MRLAPSFLLLLAAVRICAQDWPDQRFRASYHLGAELAVPALLVREEAAIANDWGFAAPDQSLPVNGFSARYRGSFYFPTATWQFEARADDGLRLWVDDRLVLDAWQGSAATTQRVLVALAEGMHRVELTYREDSGAAMVELAWSTYTNAMQCAPPSQTWCAEYFEDRAFGGQATLVNHGVGATQLISEAPGDFGNNGFSARIQGRFHFPEGFTRFQLVARDGVRLWLDDRLLYGDWRAQPKAEHEVTSYVTEGEHLVRVEGFRTWGHDGINLDWTSDQGRQRLNGNAALGTNIAALDYWSTEWTLLDAMKTAGGWYTQTPQVWDTGEQDRLDLDEHGWVRSLPAADDADVQYRTVAAVALNGTGGTYRPGRYLLLYQGQGTIEYGFDARRNAALSRPGRDVLDVDSAGNGGILIRILATNPDDYLRDIHLIPDAALCPDQPWQLCQDDCGEACSTVEEVFQAQPFQPEFLRDLRGFRVLRFMDLLHTNDSNLGTWSERPQLEDARWNGPYGAPLALALTLANQTGADPWLNVPTRADDDFVVRMAEAVRAQLAPERKVYIEYSNEIWNTAFVNGDWVEAQGQATWPDASNSAYTKRINWYGKRTAEIVGLFKDVFGAEADRVVGVMGGFAAGPWASEQALTCPLATADGTAPCWSEIDALAIAPYFGAYLGQPRFADDLAAWLQQPDGLNALFTELRVGGLLYDPSDPEGERAPQEGALARARSYTSDGAAIAARYGLQLIAYEGGQHLAGVAAQQNNAALTELFVAANRDPRMAALYDDYLRDWREAGGQLMCHFLSVGAYSRYGSWGAKEHQQQQAAPKFNALMRFLEAYPCWWPGCAAPTAFPNYLVVPF